MGKNFADFMQAYKEAIIFSDRSQAQVKEKWYS